MKETKVLIPNSIGSNISAVIHHSDGVTDKLVVIMPGHLDSKDYPHLVGLADDLAGKGYTTIRFDFTGTWESDGSITDYSIPQQLNDIGNVLKFMCAQHAYSFIALGGHSRGGFVSILYAIKDPKVSAVFGLMSPYQLNRTVDEKKVALWKKEGFRISVRDISGSKQQREFKVPYVNMEDANHYDLLIEVSENRAPLLLVAGELDDVVLSDDVKKIYVNANEPKKLVVMKGMDHDYRHHPEQIKLVNQEVIEFLSHYSH